MKVSLIASILSLVGSCATQKYSVKIDNLKNSIKLTDSALVSRYVGSITSQELAIHVNTFSSAEFEGRKTGELGQKKAAAYIEAYYKSQNIASPIQDSIYFQTIPKVFLPEDIKTTENVVAFIEGSEMPNEIVIVSAHYDHLGKEDEVIYYGADDNSSGNAAILEIAQAFKMAKADGYGPKRSILFLHLTAEEIGLQGSRYYTEYPIFPLENTIADLNIDMIGRRDNLHDKDDYIYLIGSDRLSKELHYVSEKVNNAYCNLTLDYKYNEENDSNRYYYRSDHFNFAKHSIPVIFYFNGEHEDYHLPTDTANKIDFPLLTKRTKLIFATAWQIANQDQRIMVDFENY